MANQPLIEGSIHIDASPAEIATRTPDVEVSLATGTGRTLERIKAEGERA